MNALVGAATLVRLILRRDRVRLPVWILAIAGLVYASAGAVSSAYRTPEQIATYADTMGTSPAAIAMSGPPVALRSVGGILVYETGLTAFVGVALMAVFTVVRHTRGDEEEGRTELLRSTVVGRHAPAAAALVVVSMACVAVAAGVTAAMLSADVPMAGAAVYGVAVAALGVVFAAVAAFAAQLMSNSRGAIGLSLGVLGASFLLRAIGDVGDGALSWLSPMGWSQQTRAFDDNRWWPLLISGVFALALLVGAGELTTRRDLGSGIVPARPGPAEASRLLSGPTGLALRLQRGAIIGWSAGVFIGGLVFGSMSREVQEMVDSNPTFAEYFAQAGGATLIDSFFATALLVMSLLGSGFPVASALRARAEESSGRLEVLLTTGLSRSRWLLGSLLVTLGGSLVVTASGGLGVGIGHAFVTRDITAVPGMTGYALVYLSAVLVVGAVAVLLFGWLPRYALAAWALMALYFVIGWLGGLLELPVWVEQMSPFTHTPLVPAEDLIVMPLAVMVLLVASGTALGVIGFRRRDIR